MEEEKLADALKAYLIKTAKDIWEWLMPNPADSLAMKIVKGFFKSIVALFMIAFSPIVLLFIIIIFIGAF